MHAPPVSSEHKYELTDVIKVRERMNKFNYSIMWHLLLTKTSNFYFQRWLLARNVKASAICGFMCALSLVHTLPSFEKTLSVGALEAGTANTKRATFANSGNCFLSSLHLIKWTAFQGLWQYECIEPFPWLQHWCLMYCYFLLGHPADWLT